MNNSKGSHLTQTQTLDAEALFGDLTRNWGWVLALGILFIVLGTWGLWMSVVYTVVTVMLFGGLMLAGGVFQIIDAFKCKGWKGVTLHILIGLLYIAAGIVLLTKPLAGSMVLTAMLGGAFFAIGMMRIILGLQMRGAGRGWGWVVFAGVIALILGGMVLAQWPSSALWLIGMLVAIELIMHGWSYVIVALAAREARQAQKS